jgi:phosphatidate phosphatase PAH1
VHFSRKGVIPHYTTSSDVKLIKGLGFEQFLQTVRAYNLWSASLVTETNKTLKEQHSRYLASLTKLSSSLNQTEIDLYIKNDDVDTLNVSLETAKDELKMSHLKLILKINLKFLCVFLNWDVPAI